MRRTALKSSWASVADCLSSPTCKDLGIPPNERFLARESPALANWSADEVRSTHGRLRHYESSLDLDSRSPEPSSGAVQRHNYRPLATSRPYCYSPGYPSSSSSSCHVVLGSPTAAVSAGGGGVAETPLFVHKRNERERERVRCVNEGYARLRQHLPLENKDKRVSKVETLRYAIQYINYLQKILASAKETDESEASTVNDSKVVDDDGKITSRD